jgi:hypothetical protein
METKQFEEIVRNRLQSIITTLTAKADEYARGDRLSNFKTAGALQGCTPERALGGLVAKHIVALYDFINDIDRGVVQSPERWNEKIGDIIAYMCLLDALIVERKLLDEMQKTQIAGAANAN